MKLLIILLMTCSVSTAQSFTTEKEISLPELSAPIKSTVKVMILDTQVDTHHPYVSDFFKNAKLLKFEKDIPFADHGTHVAGIIAHRLYNAYGKNITSKVEFVSCTYLANGTKDNSLEVIKCLNQAIDQGVDIVNFSGGGTAFSKIEKETISKMMNKGIILVAAAGNSPYYNEGYFPCNYGLKNIYCVANVNEFNQLHYSSNFSVNVKFVARGVNVMSTLGGGNYGEMTGTSMATPQVTAYLIAKMLGADSEKRSVILHNGQIAQIAPRTPYTIAIEVVPKYLRNAINTVQGRQPSNHKEIPACPN